MIQPPTDNLYKFLAVSGLLLAGFSVYIPIQYLEEYNRAATEYYADTERSTEKIVGLRDESVRLAQCAIDMMDADKKGATISKRHKEYCDRLEKAQPLPDPIVEWRANSEALKVRGQWIDILRANYRRAEVIGNVFFVLGLGVSIGGFWLWYIRLQKYEDAAARSKNT